MIKINTDKAYLLGLIIGGGVLKSNKLQISMPYKKWGNIKINPQRGGQIAEDILTKAKPIWKQIYNIDISYKIETDWKIICDSISNQLETDLDFLGLLHEGEFRHNATLEKLLPFLTNKGLIKSFIAGIIDTVGSLADSHRRFTSEFQIVSLEFKGKNFVLVKNIVELLIKIDCIPDQVLWNHPNQHSGYDRYYKPWKKGFKIRVALDDYLLNGSFVFEAKQLSANENKKLQSQNKTTIGKKSKIEGRTTLHIDDNSEWLPKNIRGFHFIHFLHFISFFDINYPNNNIEKVIDFEKYICPFTLLTKGTKDEIKFIIKKEKYLNKTSYKFINCNIDFLINLFDKNKHSLIFGNTENDGFMINLLLQGIAYIIAADLNVKIKGKRVLGNYLELIKGHKNHTINIQIGIPNKGTCLFITSPKHSALTGYINDKFIKKLINFSTSEKNFFRIKEPYFTNCVKLISYEKN